MSDDVRKLAEEILDEYGVLRECVREGCVNDLEARLRLALDQDREEGRKEGYLDGRRDEWIAMNMQSVAEPEKENHER